MRKESDRFGEYVPPTEMLNIAQRAAHFLDWAASKYPGYIVTYQFLAKVALRLPKLPVENSADVLQFRKNRVASIRKYLLKTYKRTLITSDKNPGSSLVRGVHLRASVDSEDIYQTTYTNKKAKIENALTNLKEVRDVMVLVALPKDAKEQVKELDRALKDTGVTNLLEALSTRPVLPEKT